MGRRIRPERAGTTELESRVIADRTRGNARELWVDVSHAKIAADGVTSLTDTHGYCRRVTLA
jgi:hypothetical protein